MLASEKLLTQIENAITDKDVNALSTLVINIEDILLEEGCFPQDLFDGIVSLIQQKPFYEMNHAWRLIKIFEEELDILSEVQKGHLFDCLQSIFHQVKDATAVFLIAEVLVDLFPNERALNTLINLLDCKKAENRFLLPHGLQRFIKVCGNSKLTKKALEELNRLKVDIDPNVMEQAKFEYSTIIKSDS